MASWLRATLLGLVVWLVPFVVAVAVFPLKQASRPLFESIMPVTLSLVVVACALVYFRNVRTAFIREGALLGSIWLVISVVIDLPLLLSPPISYMPLEYAADIGLTYLMMPVITLGIAFAASRREGAAVAGDPPCIPTPGSIDSPSGPPTPPGDR